MIPPNHVTCERMMVATPPTPPVAPETRTLPLSGFTPPLSIACNINIISKIISNIIIIITNTGMTRQADHYAKHDRASSQSNLYTKHRGVPGRPDLGGVLGHHPLWQGDRPVRPGTSPASRIRKKSLHGCNIHVACNRLSQNLFLPYACLSSIPAPVIRPDTPAVHHDRVSNPEKVSLRRRKRGLRVSLVSRRWSLQDAANKINSTNHGRLQTRVSEVQSIETKRLKHKEQNSFRVPTCCSQPWHPCSSKLKSQQQQWYRTPLVLALRERW